MRSPWRFHRIGMLVGAIALGVLVLAVWSYAADKPSLRIFYTASVKGYIDQCGCRVNPTGGIGRRATFIRQNTDASVPTLVLDGGDMIGEDNEVGRMQTQYLFRAMKEMGYHTLGLGPRDFLYGVNFLRNAEREYGFAFTSANLIDSATGGPVFAPYTIEQVGGRNVLGMRSGSLKVGVISVMGLERLPLAPPTDPTFRLNDPLAATRSAVQTLRNQTDLIVVLAYTDQANFDSLCTVEGVDAVLSCRPLRYPDEWVSRVGHTVLAYSTFQGRGVSKIDLTLNGAHHVTDARGDMAWMTADIPDDPKMAQLKQEFEQWKARTTGGEQSN